MYRKSVDVGLGDIVLLRIPGDPDVLHVKRIVAQDGQVVELSQGRLYVDGKRVGRDLVEKLQWWDTDCALNEDGLLEEGLGLRTWRIFPGGSHERVKVTANHFWTLGDNRGSSSDSRHWGEVEPKWIVGKLWWRIASRDRCGEGS